MESTGTAVAARKGLDGIIIRQVGLRRNINGTINDEEEDCKKRKKKQHDADADTNVPFRAVFLGWGQWSVNGSYD